jgi:hypothetical protein
LEYDALGKIQRQWNKVWITYYGRKADIINQGPQWLCRVALSHSGVQDGRQKLAGFVKFDANGKNMG